MCFQINTKVKEQSRPCQGLACQKVTLRIGHQAFQVFQNEFHALNLQCLGLIVQPFLFFN